jgi:hypothetical protein
MVSTNETPAGGPGLGNNCSLRNGPETTKSSPAAQAVSRDLLRDAVYDAAADAINYRQSVRGFGPRE